MRDDTERGSGAGTEETDAKGSDGETRAGGWREKAHSGDPSGQEKADADAEEAASRRAPNVEVVHRAVRQEGEEELDRTPSALAWSGLGAGLSMGFSMVGEGLLRQALPDTPWRHVVASFGYTLGFLIVVLGRQQLFTENTLTPVLPVLLRPARLGVMARLWIIVLVTNLVGAAIFAFLSARTPAFEPEALRSFTDMAREAIAPAFGTVFVRGVFAGWLIALMVWLMPAADTQRFWVVIVITWAIALGHFAHAIAGAVEVMTLVFAGGAGWGDFTMRFFVPTLLGNLVGGILLVTIINHNQTVSGQGG